ncbi:16S rRNA (cytosine(967)-C(5))-methyltransferase RsmB [Alkalibaculum bacchi]|uniref:16S rRNA (cytosine(967)-C(5))-methyltransferase RsmB n=1 Tax=Alkalibaculum bacchi TaxID=645887 RepID=UPI0026F08CA1|nr:16S rRNA (cytosine(967)-C(5))-methyltransferase RsmB [Alkalibaculum bacchi]
MGYKVDYPRELAVKTLYEINHNKAFVNIALKKSLKDSKLSSIDKPFVNTLVYGVIKHRSYCDWVISNYSKIKLKKIAPMLLEILRIGVYQVFFLDKVPHFAAVNESVNLSKKYSKGKSDKFVNGVLRSILRNKEEILQHHFEGDEKMTIKYSAPIWLVNMLKEQYPMEVVENFFEESMKNAPITARVNRLKTTKEELKESLAIEGIGVEDGKLRDYSIIINQFSDISKNPSYQEGLFIIQDEAAMMTVDLLDPKHGEEILDMCSAPGGKTTHIGEMIKDTPGLTARDIYDHKLKLIDENCKRLGLKNVRLELKDGLKFYPEDEEKYDKILLDAPCSGLGILRRKPDIKWNLSEEDIKAIIQIQKSLIKNAFDYLKPGGILVYSTCTINRRENEEVVNGLIDNNQSASLLSLKGIDETILLNEHFVQTFPKEDQWDGFFMSKIQKRT